MASAGWQVHGRGIAPIMPALPEHPHRGIEMAERKDKKKVIGEPMTDEQVKVFLQGEPEAGVDRDFHLLLRAYRSLRIEDFERFLAFFSDAGHNLGATDPQGRTLAEAIAHHGTAHPFVQALEQAANKA